MCSSMVASSSQGRRNWHSSWKRGDTIGSKAKRQACAHPRPRFFMLATESKDQFLSAFEQIHAKRKGEGPAWLDELRAAGIRSFAALGFPTTKIEDWKYTNVQPVWSQPFVQANGEAKSTNVGQILSASLMDTASQRVALINGA